MTTATTYPTRTYGATTSRGAATISRQPGTHALQVRTLTGRLLGTVNEGMPAVPLQAAPQRGGMIAHDVHRQAFTVSADLSAIHALGMEVED